MIIFKNDIQVGRVLYTVYYTDKKILRIFHNEEKEFLYDDEIEGIEHIYFDDLLDMAREDLDELRLT